MVQSNARISHPASIIAFADSKVGVIKISSNGLPSPNFLLIPITGRLQASFTAFTSCGQQARSPEAPPSCALNAMATMYWEPYNGVASYA